MNNSTKISVENSRGRQLVEPREGQASNIQVVSGEHYRIVDASNGGLANNILVRKQGDDLIVKAANGSEVAFKDFYLGNSSVDVAGEKETVTITAESPVGAELSDGSFIIYIYGRNDVLMTMVSDADASSLGIEELPEGLVSYTPASEGSNLWLWGGGLALGAGAGYSYHRDNDDDKDTTAPIITDIPASLSVAENEANATVHKLESNEAGTWLLEGADKALFTLAADGTLTLNTAQDYESGKTSFNLTAIFTDTAGNKAEKAFAVALTDVLDTTTITGIFSAGKSDGGDTVTLYKADGSGEKLGETTTEDNGAYTFIITNGYTGPVYIKLSKGANYQDELTNADKNLSTDLFAFATVSDVGTFTVNVNVQTTIAAKVLGFDGTTDKPQYTAPQIEQANADTTTALGLGTSVITTDIDTINSTGDEEGGSKEAGYVAAALSGMETGGTTTQAVIDEIAADISKGGIDKDTSDALVAGAEAVKTAADKVVADAGDGATDEQKATAENAGEAVKEVATLEVNLSAIVISADTGAAMDDFITNTKAQTITSTLDAELTGTQKLWGSVDDGETWTDITPASGTAISWAGIELTEGASAIKLAVVKDDTAITKDNIAAQKIGGYAVRNYTLDTAAPTITPITLSVAENDTAVGTLAANEAGKWSTLLDGDDKALFTLAADGKLTLTAGQDFEGDKQDFKIDATFTDTAGNATKQAITVNLTNVNEAPVKTSDIANATVVNGQVFELNVANHFNDLDADDTLTYSTTSTLPAGLTLSTDGKITGTATTDAAAVNIDVTATDAGGLTAVSNTFTLTVASKPVVSGVTADESLVKGGEAVVFSLTMSEVVAVAGTTTDFKVTFTVAGADLEAAYVSGSGSNTLVFAAINAPTTGDGAATLKSISLGSATVIGADTNQGLLTTTVGQTVADFTVDNTAPVTPSFALNVDTGSLNTDGITKDGTVNISGLEDGATWQYSTDSGSSWTTGTTGTSSFTLGENTYAAAAIQVKQTDTAGNISAVGESAKAITIDTTAAMATLSVTVADKDTSNSYSKGDEISFSFSEAVQDIDLSAFSTNSSNIFGTDASIQVAGDTVKVTLGTGTNLAIGDVISLNKAAVLDVAGNAAGTSGNIEFTGLPAFAPAASSSIDGASHIDVRTPIVLTFTEAVTATSGFDIVLTDTNTATTPWTDSNEDEFQTTGWKLDNTANHQTIAVDSSMVTINGNIVTINPEFDLDFATHYTLSIGAGAFTGGGKDSSAVDIAFDTVTPKTDSQGQLSQIQVAGTDALVDSNYWIDGHQSDPTASAINVDAASKDMAVVFSVKVNGAVSEDGNIQYNGGTDRNDIVYADIVNGGSGQIKTDTDWDGQIKTIANSAGNGAGGQIIYDAQSTAWDDKTLNDLEAGTVIYA